ncbi:MAG: amidohydrolase family protein [Rhodospirillaceae bacterium]
MSNVVIDADTHVVENDFIWDHLTEADKAYRPTVVTDQATGKEFSVIDGSLYPKGGQKLIAYPDGTRDLSDVNTRLQQMRSFGVDVQIIYPSLFLGLRAKKAETELALVRSYNRWLAETCAAQGEAMKWVAVPSTLNIAQSVSDMEEWARLGACGLLLKGFEGERTVNHKDFWPLYAKASDLGLPICVHIGHSSSGLAGIDGMAGNPVGLVMSNLVAFSSLVCSEIPAAFPVLKWGFIESGSEWLDFAISRSERYQARYDIQNHTETMLADKRLFVTCEFHENINRTIDRVGEHCLMIGTDYGHSDTSTELEALKLLEEREDIGANLASKITRENPAAFYKL